MTRKPTYNNVIWDWNGTLLNDVNNCVNIIDSLCQEHGFESLNLSTYKSIFTFPVVQSYAQLGFDTSVEAFDKICRYFHSAYEAKLNDCSLFPGTRDVLSTLQSRGIKQYILSAHEQNRLDQTIQDLELESYFSHISGSDNMYGKGKTEHGLELIRNQNIKSDQTVMIGDTLHDYEVAEKLGISCILFSGGHISRERLETTGVPVIDDLRQLPDLL